MTRVSRFRRVWSWCRSSLSNCWITTVQDGNASGSWFGRAVARNISEKRESAAAASFEVFSGGSDEVVDHLSGALHTLNRDAAATSIAQEEASGLGKLRRIGGVGHAHAQEQQQGGGDGKS